MRNRNLLLGSRWGVDRYDTQRLRGGCSSGLRGVAMKVLSKTILRLKSQIYEKQKIIDENVRMGGWNTEWRAKEFEELNSFYDAYFALIEANDFIDDLQKEKK